MRNVNLCEYHLIFNQDRIEGWEIVCFKITIKALYSLDARDFFSGDSRLGLGNWSLDNIKVKISGSAGLQWVSGHLVKHFPATPPPITYLYLYFSSRGRCFTTSPLGCFLRYILIIHEKFKQQAANVWYTFYKHLLSTEIIRLSDGNIRNVILQLTLWHNFSGAMQVHS